MKIKSFLPFLLSLVSCTNTFDEIVPSDETSITMIGRDFLQEKSLRTAFDITPSGARFTWAANDTVGIFPDEGGQVYFPMLNGAGTKVATFTGGGWALKPASTYAAYYPLQGKFYLDKTHIPLQYEGQQQVGDSSTTHLGQYDYMAAIASTPDHGKVNFQFEHLGALVQMKLTMPRPGTYQSLTLKADENLFPAEGYLDLTADSLQIHHSKMTNTLTLQLKNVTTTADHPQVTCYMMLPPMNLEGKQLSVTVTDNQQTRYEDYTGLTGKNLKAGYAYQLTELQKDYSQLHFNLTKEGTLSTLLKDLPLDEIKEFTLEGKINENDVYQISKMKNLVFLDFSNTQFLQTNYYDLGAESFCNMSQLEKVIWSKDLSRIPEGTFRGCSRLKEITFPGPITSIGYEAFAGCGFTSFEIPASVTEMLNPFMGCDQLSQLTLSPQNTSFVLEYGVIYSKDGKSLICVEPQWNFVVDVKRSVQHICQGAFRDSKITEFRSNSLITSIPYEAFKGCGNLWKITLTSNIKEIESEAFYDANHLQDIILPEGLKRIGWYAFYGAGRYGANGKIRLLSLPSTLEVIEWNCFEKASFEKIYCYTPNFREEPDPDGYYEYDGPFYDNKTVELHIKQGTSIHEYPYTLRKTAAYVIADL